MLKLKGLRSSGPEVDPSKLMRWANWLKCRNRVLKRDQTLLYWCIKHALFKPALNTDGPAHSAPWLVGWNLTPLYGAFLFILPQPIRVQQGPKVCGSKTTQIKACKRSCLRETHTCASVNVCLSHTPPSSTCATNGKLVDLVWIEDCSFTQHTHRHKSTQCQSFTTDEQNPALWFVSNTRSRPERHLWTLTPWADARIAECVEL